jgi:hypothetical protein
MSAGFLLLFNAEMTEEVDANLVMTPGIALRIRRRHVVSI